MGPLYEAFDGLNLSVDLLTIKKFALDHAGIVSNQAFTEISAHTIEFASNYSVLLDNYRDYYTMTPFLFPDAEADRLLSISDLMMILFYIDDTLGDHDDKFEGVSPSKIINRLIERLPNVLMTQEIPDDSTKIEIAIYNVFPRLLKQSNFSFMQRLLESAKAYLPANVDLAPKLDTLDSYFDYRINNSGMMPTIDLAELAHQINLPAELFIPGSKNQAFNELRRSTALIGSLVNDLFSFPKEVIEGQSDLNLIQVVINLEGLSLEKGLERAIQIVNDEIILFKHYCQVLLDSYIGDPLEGDIQKYVKSMEYIVIATYNWQMFTNRYKHPQHPFVELRS